MKEPENAKKTKKPAQFLEQYTYDLPDELIAKRPAEPRDSARLLVYNVAEDTITDTVFSKIADFLPANSLMVLNNTKVVPARVMMYKPTGGKFEVLFLTNEYREGGTTIRGMVDRKIEVGSYVSFVQETIQENSVAHNSEQLEQSNDSRGVVRLKVASQHENIFEFELGMPYTDFIELLHTYGTVPLPHYIGETGMSKDAVRERYQTVFASSEAHNEASVAAPTASLHFTDSVFASLDAKNIEQQHITLHVGQGTFATVTDEQVRDRALHPEWYSIPSSAMRAVHSHHTDNTKIITVGTTATRALESAGQNFEHPTGSTRLFIQPGYHFIHSDILITNFHLPQTSLMCLVDAFLKDKGAKRSIIDIYQYAIDHKYRFYSFGDAMLCV